MTHSSLKLSPLFLSLSLVFACGDDGSSTTGAEETATGTGETAATETGETGNSGDGDGDPATGDGDGDPTGDGDGDPTGDGDGDPTGDGDGDPTGDGDGDPTGDGDGDEPPDEGLSCGSVVECAQDCGNDLDCQDACVMMASMAGAGEYDGLVQCIIDNNCNNQNCVETNCEAELFMCYSGEGTCGEALACLEVCGPDEACQADCIYSTSGLGQVQVEDLGDCIADNDCGDDQECIEDSCGPEFAGCVGGGADTLPCPIVSDCLLDCEGDPVCSLECGPASEETLAEAEAVVACGELNDCQDFDCTEQVCPDEFVACVSGEGDCPSLIECFAGCSGNELCEYNCITATEGMAQFVGFAVYECADDNDCALDDLDCIDANCPQASAACGL